MMNTYKKLTTAVIVTLALVSCKGDGTLLDLYPLEPIVNPETSTLIVDNHIVHAWLDARQQISGITERGGFVTTDRFRSFDFSAYTWQGGNGIVKFRGDVVVNVVPNGGTFILKYSTNYGRDWEIFNETILDDDLLGLGAVYAMDIFIKPDLTVLLAIEQQTIVEKRLLLYHLDLETESSELLFSKDGATPLAMDFVDSSVGWLLFASQHGSAGEARVLKTVNGGRAWSEGAILNGIPDPAIVAMDSGRLLVYNQAGSTFRSDDGGQSFSGVSIDGGIAVLQAASAAVVYSLLADGVLKSVDGGDNWMRLPTQVQGVEVSGIAMHFRSERNGIVYGADRMFITDDGGENWRILVYPYDYVLE